MSNLSRLRDDPKAELFAQLEKGRAVFLGIKGSDQHLQPMAHHADPDARAVWFITFRQSDLVAAIGAGAEARITFQSSDEEFYADITGRLGVERNDAKLDEIWSPVAAAWFEEGREDPNVTLLKFTPRSAACWANTGSSLMFGFEVVRANVSKEHQPNIGEHVVIDF